VGTKVNLSLDDLKALAARSKEAGTQDRFIDLMLDWATEAEKTIKAMETKHQTQTKEDSDDPSLQ